MKRRLRPVFFKAVRLSGEETRRLSWIRREDALVILNLHRISPIDNPFWSPMHPAVFEELLRFVRHHFEVTTFAGLRNGAAAAARPKLVISFDDGYEDFVEYAMPLLRRYGVRVNQNVIPSSVESGRPPWNIAMYDFLDQAPRRLIDAVRVPGFSERLTGDDPESKQRFGAALAAYLKNRPHAEREPLFRPIAEAMAGFDAKKTTRMMSAAAVKAAAGEGHEIGAHGFVHESMGFEEDAFFEEDFGRCAAYFREVLGLPLEIYAFPNGSHRPSQIDWLRGQGLRDVLVVENRYARLGAPAFTRLHLDARTKDEVRLRALGFRASFAR